MGLFGVPAPRSTDQVEFPFEHDPTKGKEIIMMECKLGAMPGLFLERPIGLLALHGRDGEDDDAKSKEAESNGGAKPKDDDEEGSDEDPKGGDGTKPKVETETVETLQRKLVNAEEARNRAVDKRDELSAEVRDLKAKITKMEKDGSPDKAISDENETLKASNATLQATNERLMLEIALRDDTAHNWADPDAVLRLADLTDVDFDAKTNKPRGLKAALDKLAKDKPFLLKPKDDDNDEKKPEPRGTGKPPAPRGNTNDAKAAARAAELKRKYPALRR